MQFQPLDRGTQYNMQGGLWGLEISQQQIRYEGDDSYEEWRDAPIPSILPLMSEAASSIWSGTSLGGRCSILKGMRHDLASAVNLTSGEAYRSVLPNRLMTEANSPYANESSQRIVASLLAMQLIGAGYKVNHGCALRMGEPADKPIVGTVDGFQGNGIAGVVLHGMDTRPKSVQKTIRFMEAVRGLARQYLETHKMLFQRPANLGASDQLAHRARLTLLAATPRRLQANRPLVTGLLDKLDRFEQNGIAGNPEFSEDLVNEVSGLVYLADQLLTG